MADSLFTPEKITEKKIKSITFHYLMKWVEYSRIQFTWESILNLSSFVSISQQYVEKISDHIKKKSNDRNGLS